MTQQQDPKGIEDNTKGSRPSEDVYRSNGEDDREESGTEQVLNEEDQQNSVNPTDTEGDARGVFLDLHQNAGPGDDDDEDDDDEDAGVSDPGTEIDIPFPDSDGDADDTTRKLPSM